jgi:hypothetical protein
LDLSGGGRKLKGGSDKKLISASLLTKRNGSSGKNLINSFMYIKKAIIIQIGHKRTITIARSPP